MGRTILIFVQGSLHHLGGGPFKFEGGGDAGLRVQHDGVVGMLPAAAAELILHHLHGPGSLSTPSVTTSPQHGVCVMVCGMNVYARLPLVQEGSTVSMLLAAHAQNLAMTAH